MNKKNLRCFFSHLVAQEIKTSLVCFSFLFVVSCSNSAPNETPSLADTTLNCLSIVNSGTASTELCINQTAGHYIYTDAYGGRYSAPSNSLTPGDGVGSLTLPTGWYSGTGTVTFSDSNLVATDIRGTIRIFATDGTLVSSSDAACLLASGGGIRTVDCSAAINHYFYLTPYNGRDVNCTNEGEAATNTTPCWVEANGHRITQTLPPDSGASVTCATPGQQGVACKGNNATYRYTQEYGGRSLACILGHNPSACWLEQTGYVVSSVDGSSPCTDNALNAGACDTQPSRYVYASSYGGRSLDCTNSVAGLCFVTASTKQILEPNLIADKIKNNVLIFGIAGVFSGPGDWGSGAHRNIDTPQIGSSAEAGTYAGNGSTPNLPSGYRTVPKISIDDDGADPSENLNVEPVDRTGWGATSCGVSQTTIDNRIINCLTVFGGSARWNGAYSGNAGQGTWSLVSRSGDKSGSKGREVWRDERTGLLWSSIIGTATNWCKASGSSNATNVSATNKEDDPSDICDSGVNQDQTNAISGCFEGVGFTTTDPSIDNAGKVSMSLTSPASTPTVAWRLPTIYDYDVADANGLRFVLPDIGSNGNLDEWTATLSSAARTKAWIYQGAQGTHVSKARNLTSAFRCVGR